MVTRSPRRAVILAAKPTASPAKRLSWAIGKSNFIFAAPIIWAWPVAVGLPGVVCPWTIPWNVPSSQFSRNMRSGSLIQPATVGMSSHLMRVTSSTGTAPPTPASAFILANSSASPWMYRVGFDALCARYERAVMYSSAPMRVLSIPARRPIAKSSGLGPNPPPVVLLDMTAPGSRLVGMASKPYPLKACP